MSFLLLVIKIVAASGLLYGYYHFFLRNRPFHRYNRFFLLIAAAAAVAMPFVSIPVQLRAVGGGDTPLVKTLAVITAGRWQENEGGEVVGGAGTGLFAGIGPAGLLYGIGLALSLGLFVRSLLYLRRVRRRYPNWQINDIRFYETSEPAAPFSFFRHIFWHEDIPFNTRQGQQIFRHELYHVREGHSFDIVFMELLCCLGWFNPFFHLIKKELKVLHEFLADEHTVGPGSRLDYAELLVQQAIQQKKAGIAHPFAFPPIKRRIMMLTKNHSLHRGSGRPGRVMVLPLLLLLLSAFALRPLPRARFSPSPAARPVSVIIDAGHGGVDPGAHAEGLNEKDITLQLAQKVKELAPQYNVHVVMTRDKDELPGGGTDIKAALKKRVEMTAQEKPDMFISLHVNMSDATPRPGFEAYIAARRDDKKAQQLASSLLQQLGGLYTASPDIRRRSEQGIWVLEQNPVPAVLLECGNLSVPADRAFITDEKNQEKIAKRILEGIVNYNKM